MNFFYSLPDDAFAFFLILGILLVFLGLSFLVAVYDGYKWVAGQFFVFFIVLVLALTLALTFESYYTEWQSAMALTESVGDADVDRERIDVE